MNPIYELTDHAHSEEELAPWLDACGTGRETIDGLLLTALDCAWGNWKAAAKPPMHPYANPAYLREAETSPWRWDDCCPRDFSRTDSTRSNGIASCRHERFGPFRPVRHGHRPP